MWRQFGRPLPHAPGYSCRRAGGSYPGSRNWGNSLPKRISVLVLLCAALLTTPATAAGELTIAFPAAGQLDAALYRGPCGQVGLVDAGNGSLDEVLSQLDSWGGRSDLVWASVSHYDFDHLGDVEHVGKASGVSLSAVYDRGGDRDAKDTAAYRAYYNWATGEGLRRTVDIGDQFWLCSGDDQVTFTVVSAGTDGTAVNGVAVSEENDRGTCLHVEYRDFDLATCGDVNGTDEGSRADVESAVASAYGDVEVAKVNHHGSIYSSNETYVSSLSAEASILMVGNNGYGHPAAEVVERWRASSTLFQTLDGDGQVVDGDITVTTAGVETFRVATSQGSSQDFVMDEADGSGGATPPGARAINDSCPDGEVPDAGFTDVPSDGTHADTIDCVAWWEVAEGTGDSRYSPARDVSRAQMASFIARMVSESGGSLSSSPPDAFTDDEATPHEHSINQLADAGIVGGKTADSYDPAGKVTRAQMATFLVAAAEYRMGSALPTGENYFSDDDASSHEGNINKVAAAGITGGVSPDKYAPADRVMRAQMASFVARVLDLLVEETSASPPTSSGGGEPQVSIVSVLANPDGDDVAYDGGEYVEVRNDGSSTVSLQGWYLTDEAGHRLNWCALEVPAGATARLYTGPGTDGDDHCHAGNGSAVWNNDGDTANLYNSNGNHAATHSY